MQVDPISAVRQFQLERNFWILNLAPYANGLFSMLAVIAVTWRAIRLRMETSDTEAVIWGVFRIMMTIGFYYALMLNGPIWIPMIIDSFTKMGTSAAGIGSIAPGAVWNRGWNICNALAQVYFQRGWLDGGIGMSLAALVAAWITFLSFVGIVLHLITTMVESYIVVGASSIFLAFGATEWTRPYVERILSYAVAIGVKIFVMYLMVAASMQMSTTWIAAASGLTNAMDAWQIMGAALLLFMLCWHVPRTAAAMLGGAPALTGGDLVNAGSFFGTAAMTAGGMALSRMSAAAGAFTATRAASAGAGGGSSRGGGASGSGGPAPRQPSPPSGGGAGSAGRAATQGAWALRNAARSVPPPGGGYGGGPRMNT